MKTQAQPPQPGADNRQIQIYGGPTWDGKFVRLGYTCGPVQAEITIPIAAVDALLKILVESRSMAGGIHVIQPTV